MARLTPRETRALADAIRAIRNEKRLSQEAVAGAAGLGRNYLSDLESGRRTPSFAAVALIARGLGVSLGDVIAAYEKQLERHADPDNSAR